jgi:hypothetical protein
METVPYTDKAIHVARGHISHLHQPWLRKAGRPPARQRSPIPAICSQPPLALHMRSARDAIARLRLHGRRPQLALLEDRQLDTLTLRQRDHRFVALPNHEHIAQTSGEHVALHTGASRQRSEGHESETRTSRRGFNSSHGSQMSPSGGQCRKNPGASPC